MIFLNWWHDKIFTSLYCLEKLICNVLKLAMMEKLWKYFDYAYKALNINFIADDIEVSNWTLVANNLSNTWDLFLFQITTLFTHCYFNKCKMVHLDNFSVYYFRWIYVDIFYITIFHRKLYPDKYSLRIEAATAGVYLLYSV